MGYNCLLECSFWVKHDNLKIMPISIPNIEEQVHTKDILDILNDNYAEVIPIWMPLQVQWMNGVYETFRDYEKFMIIMHLLSKTFQFYSKNFVKLSYDEFFNQNQIEIEKYNIMDIAKNLNIPKETARRKIKELEDLGHIKRLQKKIVIDNGTWPNIQPEKTIKRMSRFFSSLSKILHEKKIISEQITSEEISLTIKEFFSHIWQLYYEMQMPMLLKFKKEIKDLESFHVWGICIVNQVINSIRNNVSHMSKEYYLDKFIFQGHEDITGVNAMSISDISGIPRATVIRKLNYLLEKKFLVIDDKKHYSSSGFHQNTMLKIQNENFKNLAKFASSIYNLNNYKKNKTNS
jgi:predicted transcriptional regulator